MRPNFDFSCATMSTFTWIAVTKPASQMLSLHSSSLFSDLLRPTQVGIASSWIVIIKFLRNMYLWFMMGVLVQKQLIRIITCSPFRAHTEPLMMANRWMPLSNINTYMTCIFVYQCLNGCVPDIFNDFYTRNRNVHGRNTRQASDLHVPYGRFDIRQNSMKIHGANMWNSIPENIKISQKSIIVFKQRLRNFLLDRSNIH